MPPLRLTSSQYTSWAVTICCTSGENGPDRSDSRPIRMTPASRSTPTSVAMSPGAPPSSASVVSAVVSSLMSPPVSGVVSSAAGSVSAVSSAPSPPPPPQAAASMAKTTNSTQSLFRPLILHVLLSLPSDPAGAEPAGPIGPTTRSLPGTSVREWPALPVVADPQPDAVQAERLEDQEPDDQDAIDDQVELVDGKPRGDARRRVDQTPVPAAGGHERIEDGRPRSPFSDQPLPQLGQVRHEAGEDNHERRPQEGARDRADAADEDDGDELHRHVEVPLLGDGPADEGGEQRPGDAGIERRDGEGERLRPELVDAHHLGGDVAVPDGHERPAGAGALQVLGHERSEEHTSELQSRPHLV